MQQILQIADDELSYSEDANLAQFGEIFDPELEALLSEIKDEWDDLPEEDDFLFS